MVTAIYGILLIISVGVLLYMAIKTYENIDINYWTIVILIPLVILGYYLKTMAQTTQAAIYCFCFIYIDSTVLLMVVLLCMLRAMEAKTPIWVKIAGYGACVVHLAIVWLCIDNQLYYKSMRLIDTGMGIATKMQSGPLRLYHWIFIAAVLVSMVIILVVGVIKKGTYSRRSFAIYSTFLIIGIAMYILEFVVDLDFTPLPAVYVAADVMICIEYDRAHAHDISCLISEQQKHRSRKGYAAFDLSGRYLSCNEKTYEFLPELKEQIVDKKLKEDSHLAEIFYKLIKDYKDNKTMSLIFDVGDVICKCEISEFAMRQRGRKMGYLFDLSDVTEEQKMIAVMKDYNKSLDEEVTAKTAHIEHIQEKLVLGLANMVENRDDNTGGHVKRTSDVIKILVEQIEELGVYNIDQQKATDIIKAAPTHDLGKITIENAILLKPGKLTDEEYAIMKTHSTKSGEFVHILLKDVEEPHFVEVAYNVARYHHERWDGRGYPEGLVGEMIPVEARIMAVADVYDALVSKRCYKESLSFDKAAQIMIEGMGTQFDPNMLPVFIGCRERLEQYYSSAEAR